MSDFNFRDLLNQGELKLFIDEKFIDSYILDDKSLIFINPPSKIEKAANIKILFEGVTIHYNQIYFIYKNFLYRNLIMTPLSGPELGHTLIAIKNDFPFKSITNHEFVFEDVNDKKNSFKISGFISNDYWLNCLTFKTKPGVYSVRILFDNIYFSDNEKLYFIFYKNINIKEIYPQIIFSNSLCFINIKFENPISNRFNSKYENEYTSYMSPIIHKFFDESIYDFQKFLQIKINNIYSYDKSSETLKFISDNKIIIQKEPDYKLDFPINGIDNYIFISYNRQQYEHSKVNIYTYNYNDIYIRGIFPSILPNKILSYEAKKIKFDIFGIEKIQEKFPIYAKLNPIYLNNIKKDIIEKTIMTDILYFDNKDKFYYMNYPSKIIDLVVYENILMQFSIEIFFNECALINNQINILVYPEFIIYDIFPKILEVYSQDLLLIKGKNVQNLNSLECLFVDDYELILNNSNLGSPNINNLFDIDNKIYVNGFFIDNKTFQCSISNILPGFYHVFFTYNRYDFVQHSSIKTIEIKDTIKLNHAIDTIYSFNYLEKIYILGENFFDSNSITCLFEYNYDFYEDIKKNDNQDFYNFMNFNFFKNNKISFNYNKFYEVKGYFIDSEKMYCDFPQFPYHIDSPFKIRVNYFYNKINYSNDFIQIFIYNSLPNGLTIDQSAYGKNKIIRCNKGNSCNSENNSFGNKIKMECSYGLYNDEEGDKFCKYCPSGFYCDKERNEFPIKCPEGNYCFKKLSSSFNDECPKGFICDNNLIKNNYLTGLEYKIISHIKCPEGYFCEGGVTNFNNRNRNKNSQKCLLGYICPNYSDKVLGNGPCPSGHYCISNYSTGILCPPRYFCNGRGNIKPILCPKGFYNDLYGQTNCKKCPEGYFCHLAGMIKPEPCANGYICDEKGLIRPYRLCPAGFICLDSIKLNFDYKFCRPTDELNICDLSSGLYKDFIIKEDYIDPKILNYINYDPFEHTNVCCYSELGVF